MKFVKYLGVLLLIVVGLFLFAANFSSVTSNYECTGEISSSESKIPKTIYIVLEEYRWWVGLWSDSEASMNLEIPNEIFHYYSHIVALSHLLQIYETQNESLQGNFQTISKILALNTPYGLFVGKCVAIK